MCMWTFVKSHVKQEILDNHRFLPTVPTMARYSLLDSNWQCIFILTRFPISWMLKKSKEFSWSILTSYPHHRLPEYFIITISLVLKSTVKNERERDNKISTDCTGGSCIDCIACSSFKFSLTRSEIHSIIEQRIVTTKYGVKYLQDNESARRSIRFENFRCALKPFRWHSISLQCRRPRRSDACRRIDFTLESNDLFGAII